jgi:CheY-like chemotaxis protein
MAKILIAEDEQDIRDLIAFALRFVGHEVISFTNGLEAWENSEKELPDLIILDVHMPVMSGIDACKKIKADPNTTHIPIVFLSAKGQEIDIQAGMDAGASEYLLKPFAPDELAKKIQEALEKYS